MFNLFEKVDIKEGISQGDVGLCLSACKAIVQKLSGDISMISYP